MVSNIWRLRRGMDRRFRSGHPWIYSNELEASPKGLPPGELVELRDSSGKFLARGYGNPQSLIAFRALSRDPECLEPASASNVGRVLQRAGNLRNAMGFQDFSHRLCFGEADGLPGLVVDRYATGNGQVFVVQAHTAGADRLVPHLLEILETYVKGTQHSWQRTAVILRNDLGVRKLEGLLEEEPRVLKESPGIDLSATRILVRSVSDETAVGFHVDLLGGQKTGFFLDQFANIELAALRLKSLPLSKRIRILDLCCYVGQWGTQLTRVFMKLGVSVEILAVDASATALHLAQKNIEAEGARCEILKGNVLKDLEQLPSKGFDVVIADPPALIKSRKDIPTGTHAYLQLFTQAFRLTKEEGGIVACSCSALLEEESFSQVLAKGAQRNNLFAQWVGRGMQSPDHPALAEFPEGRYLKGWVGRTVSRQIT